MTINLVGCHERNEFLSRHLYTYPPSYHNPYGLAVYMVCVLCFLSHSPLLIPLIYPSFTFSLYYLHHVESHKRLGRQCIHIFLSQLSYVLPHNQLTSNPLSHQTLINTHTHSPPAVYHYVQYNSYHCVLFQQIC